MRQAGSGGAQPRVENSGNSLKSWRVFLGGALVAGLVGLAAPGHAQTTVAGVTPGALSVDATGQANYTIPIDVPPGIAGMEPSLALNYSSGGGNGIAGMGTSISGLSAITRCGRTPAQDGQWGGIEYNDNDRFCLDGKRLVAVNGVYGADGTEYRTEIDGFFKVISYGKVVGSTGLQGSSPVWFRVWTKSGQIMDYGATGDSRIEAVFTPTPAPETPPEVRAWAVSQIADTVGNTMTYSYFEDTLTGAHRIDTIAYTRNDTAAVTAQSSVQFVYEARPDIASGYPGNALVTSDVRLATIRTWTDAALVRDYRLAYETSAATGRSRLLSVTECDGVGGSENCLAPTSFAYPNQTTSRSFGSETWTVASTWDPTGGVYTWTGDFNGDGLTDIASAAGGNVYMKLSAGSGFVSETWTVASTWDLHGGFTWTGDFNGDGLTDIASAAAGNIYMKLSNGAGFASETWPVADTWDLSSGYTWPGDFNGDGLTDIASAAAGNIYMKLSTGAGFVSETWTVANTWDPTGGGYTWTGDFNGDGLTDIASAAAGNIFMKLSTGSGFVSETWTVANTWDPTGGGYTWTGDFNGDGLTDIASAAAGNVYMKLSTGTGFVSKTWTVADTWDLHGGYTWPGDFNDDGLTDIASAAAGNIYMKLSNGAGFVSETWPVANTWDLSSGYTWPGDFNGDGLTDIASAVEGNIYMKLARPAAPDSVSSITDSLGSTTTLSYQPLTNNTVYTKSTDAVFPVQDIQAPLYVVSEVSRPDGVGGQAVTRYSYAGAKVDLTGRGFLGFRFMDSVDPQIGIVTTTRYAQAYPFTGQIEVTETYIPDPTELTSGITLSRTTNTLAQKSLNLGATVFPYVSQSVAESYEFAHGNDNLPVTTTTSTSVFDDYGNPTKITVATSADTETFTTVTDSIYTNNNVNWHIGRVTRTTVTNTLPAGDGRSATRVSSFAYNPTTGLLSQEVIEPDSLTLSLTTDYTRDAFGHITKSTVSGPDIATRSTNTEFAAAAPNYGRFATKAINALGHEETRTHDARFGTIASVTGPNGITTTWTYDGFGRKTREDRADGTATVMSYDLCTTQCPIGGIYAVTSQNVVSGISPAPDVSYDARKVGYYDALNRVFRTETQGFDGTPVFADTVFNALGQVEKVSRPYFDGTAPLDIQWTTTTYDGIGRVKSVTAPNGGVETIDYNGLTTTATNALDHIEVRVNNVLGQLIRSTNGIDPIDGTGGINIDYAYDPFGNLESTDTAGVLATFTYDIRGRKGSMTDTNMGIWNYEYNALGEMVKQTDGKNQITAMTYDLLGRVKTRTEAEGTTTWDYDNPLKTASIGKLDRVSRTQDDYVLEPFYDSLGRPQRTETTYETRTYLQSTTYDSASRPDVLTYPAASDSSRFAVENVYNSLGYLDQVREFGGATVYWQVIAVNAAGQVTEESLGNGLTTLRGFDAATGLIDSIGTYSGLTPIHSLTYDFDFLGNLRFRTDELRGREETLNYDINLSRLRGATVVDTTTALPSTLSQVTVNYDTRGNITYKSDVGTYAYNGIDGGLHAVTQAGNKTYLYDGNGAMTSSVDATTSVELRRIAWGSFNKPTRIDALDTASASEFVYGPNRARIKQATYQSSLPAKTVTYIGGAFERHALAGSTSDELVHYIRAGSTVAIFKKIDDGITVTDRTQYLHRDHIGSVSMITDATGAVVEERSYDAWGKPRNADWTPAITEVALDETKRGFTGHEHLDNVGLIHMNGRVYDPTLGRFISGDPFVQAPNNSQSYNRYSYVLNNPLSFTDPSGFKIVGKIGRALSRTYKRFIKWTTKSYFGQAIGIFTFTAALGPIGYDAYNAAVMSSQGASLSDILEAVGKDVAIRFASAAASAGVGTVFSGLSETANIYARVSYSVAKGVTHGVVGGTASKLRGNEFNKGFWTGFGLSMGTDFALYLRKLTTEQSKLDPRNSGGESGGFKGDGVKNAGGRLNQDKYDEILWLECSGVKTCADKVYWSRPGSPFGGHQSGPGRFLWKDRYEPGSIYDRISEAYAGPHDMANSWFWYNHVGNIRQGISPLGKFFGEILNISNLVMVTPLVVTSMVPEVTYGVVSSQLEGGPQW